MERKKIQRSRHDDNYRSQSRDHIPLDLIMEILSRLPAKSIARSRSVSKLWSSITTTSYFINSLACRSPRPCVLLFFHKRDKLFVFSSPLHQNTYPQVENYQYQVTNRFLRRYDYVHGLIYLDTSIGAMIWNPTMKRFFKLPLPQHIATGYLGYDPIERKYKLLCILNDNDDRIGILTLGAQESWRIVLPSEGVPLHWYSPGCVLCINGVIYYEGTFGMPQKRAIMSFDMRSEKFSLIDYPIDNCHNSFLVSYEGRLALIIGSDGRACIEFWILEDHQWVYTQFPSPNLPYAVWRLLQMKLKGVTDAGEFIYIYTPYSMDLNTMERSLYEWFHIVFFDPKKKTSREFKIQGIAFDVFKRLRVRRSDLFKSISVMPNHIESLMSF